MVELNGKRVVVTGGASGIGRETVRLLAAGGAIVIGLPAMLCTGEYRSVNESTASPSTRPGLRRLFR